MLNFNQKYICAYNKNTFQHYILKIDFQSHVLTLPPLFFSYPYYVHHSTSKTNDTKLQSLLQKYKENHNPDLSTSLPIKVINLKEIFQKMGICIEVCSIKQLYVAQLDRYCQFQELTDIANCMPIQFVEAEVILLRFSYIEINSRHKFIYENQQYKINENKSTQDGVKIEVKNQKNVNINELQISQPDDIKQRDRSRSIGQIIQFVRKWRHIADEGINGVKCNLQQAALYVGIPKKSLDDYFYQLRVGQKYGFNFQLNWQKNISFLRKFVKQKIPSRHRQKLTTNREQQISKNQDIRDADLKLFSTTKLPKKLKQITPTKLIIPEPNNQQKSIDRQAQDNRVVRLSDSEVSSIPHIWPNPNVFNPKQKGQDLLFDDQDSFFNDFKLGHENFVSFNHLLRPEGDNYNNNQDKNNQENSL